MLKVLQIQPIKVNFEPANSDPGIYDGCINKNQKRNGLGKCRWQDGSHYEGDWIDGFRCGNGVIFEMDGT